MTERPLVTAADFRAAVGRDPRGDDLDRVNCGQAGEFGHLLCGWNAAAGLPEFMAPTPDRLPAPAAPEFEWKHGGAEALRFTNLGRHWWAAVWQEADGRFRCWVSGPRGRFRDVKPTEADAFEWCEATLKEKAASPPPDPD